MSSIRNADRAVCQRAPQDTRASFARSLFAGEWRGRPTVIRTGRYKVNDDKAKRRTDLVDCLLDLLDFIEEKVREALADPACQFAAVNEAAGAIPLMRDRLQEDGQKWTLFVLAFGTKIEEGYWQDWWQAFAKIDREKFLKEGNALIASNGPVQNLKNMLTQ
jgi:hypothetical protein